MRGARSRLPSPLPSPPPPSSPKARSVMLGNRSVDTKPEVALRRELHRRGLRFRKHVIVVVGLRCRPDIVFPRARVAVECRGCFWHLCPDDAVLPKSNLDYWLPKLERNVARDQRNERALAAAGWTLIVVWEHEDLLEAADRIEAIVVEARCPHSSGTSASVTPGQAMSAQQRLDWTLRRDATSAGEEDGPIRP